MSRRRVVAPVFVALSLVLGSAMALAACGGDDGGTAKPKVSGLEQRLKHAPIAPTPTNLIADDDFFLPEALKVKAGTQVTFSNDGHRVHNVIPLDGGTFRVDTDEFRPGMSKTVQLDAPGTYRYFCSIHGTATRGMRGIIEVVR